MSNKKTCLLHDWDERNRNCQKCKMPRRTWEAMQGSSFTEEGEEQTDIQRSASQAVRELVFRMDEKFTRWDIYRTCLGAWKLKAEQATQTCEIESDDFVGAMEEALAWRSLPLVPRPPSMLYRELFLPRKSGSKWRVMYGHNDCCIQVDTKKEAEAFIDRKVAMSKSECDGWEINYGWSRNKVEGVDFRWAR